MGRPAHARRRREASSSDDDTPRGVADASDEDVAPAVALARARAAQQARKRDKGVSVGALQFGRASRASEGTESEGGELASRGGASETRMIGTSGAFAAGGVVLAGREMVRDELAGGGGGGEAYGLRTAEEARAKAYVEEELRRRRGEVGGGEDASGGLASADADDRADADHRGAESWLTAIEEVDVSVERRMQNIEETERLKRALLEGKRPGERGAFEVLKPTHLDVKEAKKRPPPSEAALARAQFVGAFGAKRARQEATEENKREREQRKNFFKKKKKNRK